MAAWPYSTAQWQRLRLLKLQSEPLCQECRSFGRIVVARVVDHVVPVKHGGAAFPALSGLRSLCWRCHSAKTARGIEAGPVRTSKPRRGCDADGRPLDAAHPWGERRMSEGASRARPDGLERSAVPLTIICGPPGSGKTTLARERAKPLDIVIDLDDILVKLSGEPRYAVSKRWLAQALELRNNLLQALATERAAGHAFFIVGAPTHEERQWWQDQLGGDVILLAVPAGECLRRIAEDADRKGMAGRYVRPVHEWWDRFTDSEVSGGTTENYKKSLISETPRTDAPKED
ncbi:MAG: AAA family ATPase [Sandarakinorhabdus sp.]|nr:AAA family ATPase [Sandarakinorhabdus sp.]